MSNRRTSAQHSFGESLMLHDIIAGTEWQKQSQTTKPNNADTNRVSKQRKCADTNSITQQQRMRKQNAMSRIAITQMLAISLVVFASCSNPESSQLSSKQMKIIGVAGIATANAAVQGYSANLAWNTDSTNIYRVPRSVAELNHQIASGFIEINSSVSGKKKYTSALALRGKWWGFNHNAVEFDQSNGPPEELALATNISCSDDVDLYYKVNYSDWVPMKCGIDFGRFGFDSLAIESLNLDNQIDSHWTLLGVNLMKDRRNFLLEGSNSLIIKLIDKNSDSSRISFNISYIIK